MSDVREQGIETVPQACERPSMTPEPVVGASAVVVARDLTRRYGSGDAAVDALGGVSIDLARGRFTAIMGPSGSGKSTLMHVLAGLDDPTSGSVWIDGVEITALKERQLTKLRRDKIGFIFQTFNLLPMLTAKENLVLPLTIAGAKLDDAWLATLVEEVALGDRLGHRPSELSGGQQQRVAIARALVSRPVVIFADEPTGNLDSKTGDEVLGLLRRSADEFGQTIVMVTHDARAATVADRIVFLQDGRVELDCGRMSRDEIYDTIKSLEATSERGDGGPAR
jgi:putative ABC transport system ATP-binding protein